MIIVADQEVAFVDYYFADHARVISVLSTDIMPSLLADTAADILVIRSKTRVTNELLANSKVRYILSCVSGTDHLPNILPAGVMCWHASGCNALAVSQYMQYVMASLSFSSNAIVGVIGVGAVGSRVVAQLTAQGYHVLQCDPLRAAEPGFAHQEFTKLLPQVDALCLHVPLTYTGPYATVSMLDHTALTQLKSGAIIVNASRGEVIDEMALLTYQDKLQWCLDVWQNEPYINAQLAHCAHIATPHIAGHTWQGKVQGTHDCYHQLAHFMGWTDKALPPGPEGDVPHAKLLATSEALKKNPVQFQMLRQGYCPC